MRRSLKVNMAAAAVVAAGILATPAAASLTFPPLWDLTGPFDGTGSLTLTSGPVTTTCTTATSGTLFNVTLVTPHGEGNITAGTMGPSAGAPCSTNLPGCAVAAMPDLSFPWGIHVVTGTMKVQVSNIRLSYQYTGTTCALNGVTINASGNLEGTFTNAGNLAFSSAAGMTTTAFGAAVVNSNLLLVNQATATPVSLL